MEINYFDFLRMYPDIIIENFVDKIDFINYIEILHKKCIGKKPLIKIDQNKLSEIVYNGKTNKDNLDIFKNEIKINIYDDTIIIILHTDKRRLFYFNDSNERFGQFYISGRFNLFLDSKFYYLNNNEIKNIKRSLLIDKCLI